MKKLLLSIAICALTVCGLYAQGDGDQFVSTTPSNKNVVLEEYTGVNCQYCPDGHRRANEIAAAHPGRVFIINVHQGSFSNNTYTTQFGDALANQTGLSGWPAGTINRHVFSDLTDQGESTHTVTDLNRGYWATAAGRVMAESSPVNIAARGTLDWGTRELSITVQLYYTASETNSTNKLNVAILQDNVLGSQTGASTWNPSQMVGNQYRHMHMLRHLITGQWGDDITTTTQGSFVEKTYTYTIPASLGSPNAIAAKLEDLTFVAFVAQGQQEILTGCEVEIENLNMPALSARIDALNNVSEPDCSNEAKVSATVSNIGSDAITSLTFEYSVANGTPMTYNWTGNIASMASEAIELPTMTINTNTNQIIKVKIVNANGQDFESTQISLTIKKVVVAGENPMVLKIKTDGYASETSFKLYGPNNNVIMQNSSFTNQTEHTFDLNFPSDGCYRLEVLDSYGDGMAYNGVVGYVKLFAADGTTQLFNASGSSFSDKLVVMIAVGAVDIDDETFQDMVIFPNPTSDKININSESDIQMVELYNLQGQRVYAENGNVRSISVSNLAKGMYILKVTTEQGVSTYKISKQ